MKLRPRADSPLSTQLLHGEAVTVFDETEGWGWVQAERDGYVGYVAACGLAAAEAAASHRVVVNRTFIYPAPDMKQPIMAALPLDGRVAVHGASGTGFAKLRQGGYVIAAHLAELDEAAPDYVAVAEALTGSPYLWGGKSAGGIDCSGLVQLATSLAGRRMARDTDLQQSDPALSSVDRAAGYRRGDLVFWKGHVGIMIDADDLLHANGHHMLVMRESLHAAQTRIAASTGALPAAVKRFIR